ncbi:MAG: hypothetical protein EOO43_17305 [Flavobacterium sp.]|nr:MAG: hypothetical protein EOO43_17305 [Flavobacterium sp.]
MKISCKEFELELKHAFSIAKFTRTSTPLLLLKVDYEGKTGYGEASMVPYMGESYETAHAFLKKVEWNRFQFPFDFAAINEYLDDLYYYYREIIQAKKRRREMRNAAEMASRDTL